MAEGVSLLESPSRFKPTPRAVFQDQVRAQQSRAQLRSDAHSRRNYAAWQLPAKRGRESPPEYLCSGETLWHSQNFSDTLFVRALMGPQYFVVGRFFSIVAEDVKKAGLPPNIVAL